MIRQAIHQVLDLEGYQVTEAPNGTKGLALLAQSDTAVVALVDYRIPEVSGCELLHVMAEDRAALQRHAYVLVTANVRMLSPGC
jgi:CheY-like chemotaxis protein